MKNQDKPIYLLLFVVAFAVNIAGINVRFFTDDPALYAAIAKNMLYKHDMWQLFTHGQDWLDKPHFPFWMAALSFKIFGVSVWAYKLPALLFFLISARYTYLFARKYYDWEAAAVAVLILMTAQYVLMANTDVRAEPYLMGLIIASIYHIAGLEDQFNYKDLLLAALFTACAIMTKGIFVIVAIYGALLGQAIFKRKLLSIFAPRYLSLYVLTIIFTLPEFYALYRQFDLHPEKVVFDKQNVSGIKWFLWDSQFGRFVNTGPIARKGGDPTFYLHTLLWAFGPWCLMFYYALYKTGRKIYNKVQLPEYYTISGGLLLLVLFSLSGFQLPFYTNILFPLFAVITAPYCYKKLSVWGSKFRLFNQWIYIVLFTIACFVINLFLKPANAWVLYMAGFVYFLLISVINKQVKDLHRKAFFINCSAVLFANFYLVMTLYPILASYNGATAAGRFANQSSYTGYHLYSARLENNAFQFESNRPVGYLPIDKFSEYAGKEKALIFATQNSIDYLNNNNISYRIVKEFYSYQEERILPKFVNADTRNETLSKVYLISK